MAARVAAASAAGGPSKATETPQRSRRTLKGMVKEAAANIFGILSLANFASAAFVEFCLCILLKRLYPQAWFVVRILVTRWAWLGPILACNLNNIKIMVTGQSDLIGPLTRSHFGLHRYGLLFRRDRERAFCVMNHLSWADSFMAGSWLYAHNSVNEDMCWPLWKWFLYSPLGWLAIMTVGCPLLGYGKEKDIQSAQQSASRFFERWFTKYFIFPEGGIFREELLQKSHAYAAKMNYPKLDHCLLPKTAALYEVGKLLREQGMKTVADLTIAYPRDSAWAKDPYDALSVFRYHEEPVKIYLHVRRRAMEDAQWDDEEKVRQWITDVFVDKDQILDLFYQNKGPMIEGAKEERDTAGELAVDVMVWTAIQALFYKSLYVAASTILRLAASKLGH